MMHRSVSPFSAPRVLAAFTIGVAALMSACSDGPTSVPLADPEARLTQGGVNSTGCAQDSKSLGLIKLSAVDAPDTWWGITKAGFAAAGITDPKSFIENAFGQEFESVEAAAAFLVLQVKPYDLNGNDLVCAFSTRGTRSVYRAPNVALYLFRATDDR
ncbi:hypothetical protein [Gemmatimonas groenlandica]|uniref:Lipoprotein n=1 Tax=Gemmatimonas groenlandica TaxID=2732249 RepID=A0A6M4INA6_9BACT|nr:hypothetical protein [Gemmatimonas groenlandica]QJR35408.1 hypothetical protein HKW67_07755 [Gemmatimonas groenlandica]